MELLVLYTKSLKSPYTQRTYARWLSDFQKSMKAERLEDLLSTDSKVLADMIIAYLLDLESRRHLSYQTRQLALAAVKHFYEINDITLNWRKIARFLGENKKTVEDRAYTREEIHRLLEKCDERKRVIVLTLASTGMRLGAIASLKMRHLKRIDDIYQFTLYEGTKDKHITFCTIECAGAIDSYLDYRKLHGEKIGPQSPFIRNQFDRNDPFDCAYSKGISPSQIQTTIFNLLLDCGLRQKTVSGQRYQRKEVMSVHGFRKWFSTNLSNAIKNPVVSELLLGHDVGLTGVYFKPDAETLYHEYLKGMDALTIDEANRLQRKNEELEKKVDDISLLKAELAEQRRQMAEQDKLIQDSMASVDFILQKAKERGIETG